MSYQQLTEGQRYQISVLRTQAMSVTAMARAIGVHRSTLYRELQRNSQPTYAQQQARLRRTQARKARIPNCVIPFVEQALSWRWSPEQISAIGKRIGLRVNHEWIYRYVATDKALGGQLYRYLRQGHKRYRKGSTSRCSPIK
jgi:transposase, IS30 family